MYDPSTGRFLTEDPIAFDGNDPNLYRYAGNDPVNSTDPTGTTQQGNPLNNLFNSGPTYSANQLFGGAQNINISRTPTRNSSVTTLPLAFPAGAVQPARSDTVGIQTTPRLVREITPGRPIVPQTVNDLPGVRQALENSNRYVISNHSDQGNFVVDLKDGGVRLVTGDPYLPIDERYRRAGIEGRNAANLAQFMTLAQEALVSASPIHETSRDVGVSLFGYDYVEPNRTISTNDRLQAGFLLFAPGGNSGQVRLADDFVDEVLRINNNKQISRLREFRVDQKLQGRFGAENVLTERTLLDARGNKVVDPVTGTGRRLDFVVLDESGNARYLPEVTSRNQALQGGKRPQLEKERRVQEAGGVFVRDPQTGRLIDISNAQTRIIGVEPRR